MNKKLLIVGRTGAGKDTFAKLFDENMIGGATQIKSYTTRPKRSLTEDTHIFIKPEEADQYRDSMIAYTKIGEFEYFATLDQLKENDIYIIDPIGVKSLFEKTKGQKIGYVIAYITADEKERTNRALSRGNATTELTATKKRNDAEDAQFSKFEKFIKNKKNIVINGVKAPIVVIENNGDLHALEKSVRNLINEHFIF